MGCKLAARLGYAKLKQTGSVLDAVEAAVKSMELDENFNAGKLDYSFCSSKLCSHISVFQDTVQYLLWMGTLKWKRVLWKGPI